jgi:hypothetical protein
MLDGCYTAIETERIWRSKRHSREMKLFRKSHLNSSPPQLIWLPPDWFPSSTLGRSVASVMTNSATTSANFNIGQYCVVSCNWHAVQIHRTWFFDEGTCRGSREEESMELGQL